MAKKPEKTWVFAPRKSPTEKVPVDLKAAVTAEASELIEKVLKPKHVQPPPKKPRFNYVRITHPPASLSFSNGLHQLSLLPFDGFQPALELPGFLVEAAVVFLVSYKLTEVIGQFEELSGLVVPPVDLVTKFRGCIRLRQ